MASKIVPQPRRVIAPDQCIEMDVDNRSIIREVNSGETIWTSGGFDPLYVGTEEKTADGVRHLVFERRAGWPRPDINIQVSEPDPENKVIVYNDPVLNPISGTPPGQLHRVVVPDWGYMDLASIKVTLSAFVRRHTLAVDDPDWRVWATLGGTGSTNKDTAYVDSTESGVSVGDNLSDTVNRPPDNGICTISDTVITTPAVGTPLKLWVSGGALGVEEAEIAGFGVSLGVL